MTDRPYTDADLRMEAARQLAALAEDPDTVGVSEQMADSIVDSTDDGAASGTTWNQLLVAPAPDDEYEAFDTAREKVHSLITGAADLSEWAVDLGADGLQPTAEALSLDVGIRVHFAFTPDMPDDVRRAWINGIGHAIREGL